VIDAPATAVPAARVGTSPAPRMLVPFHAESSLWPYPRAPLDDRDDIVELDFADTSALSDVDAFERRRQNGRNAKFSKKDRAREREEIERSWDTPGNGNPVVTSNVVVGAGSPGPNPVWSRPSSSQALSNGSAVAAWSSPQSAAPKVNRTNIASALVKTPCASSSGAGGQATAPAPSTGNNKSAKAKSKHAVNGSNAKVSVPDAMQSQAQTNGATALAKSAANDAIVEAVHAYNHPHSNVNGSSASLSTTTDRNEFVREVITLIHVRFLFLSTPILPHFFPFRPPHSLLWIFKRRIRRSWIDFGLNIVRGPRPLISSPLVVVRLYIGVLAVPSFPRTSPTPHSPPHISLVSIPCHPVSHRDIKC